MVYRFFRLAVAAWLVGALGLTPAQAQLAQLAQAGARRRLPADIGLVVNRADPYSVAVGEYYAQQRGLAPEQVLYVEIPVKPDLSRAEFFALQAQIHSGLDNLSQEARPIRALALAWAQPYAVECNGITAAVTLGFDPEICTASCKPSHLSPLFGNALSPDWPQQGIRPSMLLAARSVDEAKALIDRGVAADQQLGKRGVPLAHAVFVSTPDKARNVREPLFPPPATVPPLGLQVVRASSTGPRAADPLPRVILYQTGAVREAQMQRIQWLPGALADHLTSYGGRLLDATSQMSVLDWISAGATASYGTVSEPCNHPQKFPHPSLLLARYATGASALEAYWSSVAWPTQGVFVGEPLAAPFGR